MDDSDAVNEIAERTEEVEDVVDVDVVEFWEIPRGRGAREQGIACRFEFELNVMVVARQSWFGNSTQKTQRS